MYLDFFGVSVQDWLVLVTDVLLPDSFEVMDFSMVHVGDEASEGSA